MMFITVTSGRPAAPEGRTEGAGEVRRGEGRKETIREGLKGRKRGATDEVTLAQRVDVWRRFGESWEMECDEGLVKE